MHTACESREVRGGGLPWSEQLRRLSQLPPWKGALFSASLEERSLPLERGFRSVARLALPGCRWGRLVAVRDGCGHVQLFGCHEDGVVFNVRPLPSGDYTVEWLKHRASSLSVVVDARGRLQLFLARETELVSVLEVLEGDGRWEAPQPVELSGVQAGDVQLVDVRAGNLGGRVFVSVRVRPLHGPDRQLAQFGGSWQAGKALPRLKLESSLAPGLWIPSFVGGAAWLEASGSLSIRGLDGSLRQWPDSAPELTQLEGVLDSVGVARVCGLTGDGRAVVLELGGRQTEPTWLPLPGGHCCHTVGLALNDQGVLEAYAVSTSGDVLLWRRDGRSRSGWTGPLRVAEGISRMVLETSAEGRPHLFMFRRSDDTLQVLAPNERAGFSPQLETQGAATGHDSWGNL